MMDFPASLSFELNLHKLIIDNIAGIGGGLINIPLIQIDDNLPND